jgi:hypothetical protein
MQNQIFLTGMVLAGVVVGLVAGILVTLFWNHWRSRRFRARHSIPDIRGMWRCQWFDDASGSNEPKIEDTVQIQQWTTEGQFLARGFQPEFHLAYPIMGEIDPSRVVTLAYKAARYPYEPNRGVVCIQLARDGKTMEGHWFGRRFSNQLGGGKVRFERVFTPVAALNTAASRG